MIERYNKTEISNLWNEEAKFKTYLQVELAILKALEGNKVPAGICEKIEASAVINPKRIAEIEAVTKHDIIAFCTSITENIDPEIGKYFHFGVTSSDIIDTALTLQIKNSLEVVLPAFKSLLDQLAKRAIETKTMVTIGRSHGMFAEPVSFGQKLLGFWAELKRRYDDLEAFYKNDLTVQYSGAVGSYTILSPEDEAQAAKNLGLNVEPVSTQVIPRDRIAKMIGIHALIGSAIERISVEIRHLHRSDVAELHEGFSKGQKGSSTMPHKKNPISAENLTGMARVLRSHQQIANDNIVLWHERDISHSSTERLYLPDNFGVLFYAITRLDSTIENLVFHKEEIERKVKENHTYLSSYYLHQLLLKTSFKREDLYYIVQQASFEGAKENSREALHAALVKLLKEKDVVLDNLPIPTFEEVKNIFMAHVDTVFERSLK